MKHGASNIAWPAEADTSAWSILKASGINHVELAPSRVWPNWHLVNGTDCRRSLADAGLAVCSLQAILFQKPELRLFGTAAEELALLDHLRFCADLAAELGAARAVFGAPKNRDRGELSSEDAFGRASQFFARAGEEYAKRGVMIGFEPNPVEYGCNFGTTASEAAKLVRRVASPGFGLHLDTACVLLAGEDIAVQIRENADILCHFHASEPQLETFGNPRAGHEAAAKALREIGYPGIVVLEMRAAIPPLPALAEAVACLRDIYGT